MDKNKKIGIFFGSDYGTTENIAKSIKEYLHNYNNELVIDIFNINNTTEEDFSKYEILLLGTSTSYYGELQSDWEDFLPKLKDINFNNKLIGLFGCGNQEDYPECFCDGIGILYEHLYKESDGPDFIGRWVADSKDYKFSASKATLKDNNNCFLGLIIDDDNQPDLTETRIEKWVKQIINEIEEKE